MLSRPNSLTLLTVCSFFALVYVYHVYNKQLIFAGDFHSLIRDMKPLSTLFQSHGNLSNLRTLPHKRHNYASLPRTIWLLWDKGWHNAPALQAACLRSWKRHNTNYEVRALDLPEAERLIQRETFYSNEAWKSAAIQAKSDIIRTELLARYGGVWADSSLFCNEPLDNWLPGVLNWSDFFTFERHDSAVKPDHRPWISSWFIASPNTSLILSKWLGQVRSEWSKKPFPNAVYGYFWLHRIFAKLVKTDPKFKEEFSKVFPFDAAGPHCFVKDLPVHLRNITPPVYKAKAGPCAVVKKMLLELDKKLQSN